MIARTLSLAIALAIGGAAFVGEANAGEGRPKIGPFWPGIPFEQARAVAPNLKWRDLDVAPYTKKVLAIGADDAVEIGGFLFNVELHPGFKDNYELIFRRSQLVADPAECQRAVQPIVEAMEEDIGSFSAAPRYDASKLKYHEEISVGKHSKMSFETDEDMARRPRTGAPEWRLGIAQRFISGSTVQVASNYFHDLDGARRCGTAVVVQRDRHQAPESRERHAARTVDHHRL